MPLDQFLLDHYVLDSLDMTVNKALVEHPYKKSLQRLHEDIQVVAQEWEPNALELIKDFVALCCASELSYVMHTESYWTGRRFECASQAYKIYSRQGLLEGALKIFQCGGWHGGYGGPKWVVIAEAALNNTLPPRAGINVLVNACHNGGSVFNRYFEATPTFKPPIYASQDFAPGNVLASLSRRGPCFQEKTDVDYLQPPLPLMAEAFSCLKRSIALQLTKACIGLYTPSEYEYPAPLSWAGGVLDPQEYILGPEEAAVAKETADEDDVEEQGNERDD